MGMVANAVTRERGLRTAFFKAQEGAGTDYLKVATVVPSDGPDERYGWLGSAPGMREFKDERIPKGLIGHDYTIKNKEFEASIAVKRADLEDDRYGQIKIRVEDMGQRAAEHPNELVFGLLQSGEVDKCYDGKAFFADDHAEGESGVQDNLLAGTGITVATLSADFGTAKKTLLRLKDDRGKPFHSSAGGLVVVAPPDLEQALREMLNAEIIGSTSNVLRGSADLVITPYLTDANDWYLLKANGALKPLLWQRRIAQEFSSLDDPKGEAMFMRGHATYGVRYRGNAGYGFWQMAMKIKNA